MTDKITNHSQRDVKKVANDTNSVCDSLHLGAKPSDKIKEELEKEIKDRRTSFKPENVEQHLTNLIDLLYQKLSDEDVRIIEVYVCQAKLAQHLATKQAMIKEFEKMIDERMNDIPDVFENSKQMIIYEELKELKSKLHSLHSQQTKPLKQNPNMDENGGQPQGNRCVDVIKDKTADPRKRKETKT